MSITKILQFPIANSYGGITHYALDNWYRMDKSRFHCDFATISKKLDFEDEISKSGAEVYHLSCYPTEDELRFREEFNAILDNGYDVVHLHTKQWKNFIVEEICKERGIRKVIVHAHSTRCDNNDPIIRERETKTHEEVKKRFKEDLATDFWACSSDAAKWLFGEQIPDDRIIIMRNAISVDKFLYNEKVRKRVREELGLSEGVFVIGNVGRLCYQKNQELLIRAYAEMCKAENYEKNIETKLLIVGEGEYRQRIEKLIKDLGVADRVLLLGLRNDVHELYQAFDLMTMTSRFEGLGMTLIEAQCSGLKCLVNKTIPREAEITENIVWVDDEVNAWSRALLDNTKRYARKNMKNDMIKSGYSLDEQIKIIEAGYSS